jgi:crotonobetainyl-CoA:carnitine CoA-transferase CaiB-like acyl-CoA transferase
LPGSTEVGIGLPSALGEDTERVLGDWLGMPAAEVAALRDAGVLR